MTRARRIHALAAGVALLGALAAAAILRPAMLDRAQAALSAGDYAAVGRLLAGRSDLETDEALLMTAVDGKLGRGDVEEALGLLTRYTASHGNALAVRRKTAAILALRGPRAALLAERRAIARLSASAEDWLALWREADINADVAVEREALEGLARARPLLLAESLRLAEIEAAGGAADAAFRRLADALPRSTGDAAAPDAAGLLFALLAEARQPDLAYRWWRRLAPDHLAPPPSLLAMQMADHDPAAARRLVDRFIADAAPATAPVTP